MIIVMVLICITLASIGAAYFMPRYRKIATIVMDSTLGFACKFRLEKMRNFSCLVILLGIALAVFMVI